jgi:hypothetical protein
MSATAPARPEADEYAPFYEGYVSLVPDGDVLETLRGQSDEVSALLAGIDEERGAYAYAPGKWSIKQVVGHLIDTERVFSYRAMAVARGERQPLPGMDQDEYMAGADFDVRTLADLAEEFAHLRRANLLMLRGLSEEAWSRRGVANGCEVTVRALAYIIAGHAAHHVQVLRTRYL